MPEPVMNPRRNPRAPIGCDAQVVLRLSTFVATRVLDYGPGGCQLEASGPVERGARVYLRLANASVPVAALLTGRVAWSSDAEPWRIGVAFDDDVLTSGAARAFFERLEAAHPDVGERDCFLDAIPEDAQLAPTPPPARIPELSPEEIDVLRTVGPAMRVDALRAALGDRWAACANPIFALLGRRYLVVGAPDDRAASEWARRLRPERSGEGSLAPSAR